MSLQSANVCVVILCGTLHANGVPPIHTLNPAIWPEIDLLDFSLIEDILWVSRLKKMNFSQILSILVPF